MINRSTILKMPIVLANCLRLSEAKRNYDIATDPVIIKESLSSHRAWKMSLSY